jgi:hypothetical protein
MAALALSLAGDVDAVIAALAHASAASRASICALREAEARRRWAYLRAVHAPDALAARVERYVSEAYKESARADAVRALTDSVRAHVTAGPVFDHVRRVNAYDTAVYHYAFAYEWDGRRVCYTCSDSNAGGSWEDAEYSGFSVRPLLAACEAHVDANACAYEFWRTGAGAGAVEEEVGEENAVAQLVDLPLCARPTPWSDAVFRRLQESRSLRCSYDDLLRGFPPHLWLLLVCLSARETPSHCGWVGWALGEELVATPLSRVLAYGRVAPDPWKSGSGSESESEGGEGGYGDEWS